MEKMIQVHHQPTFFLIVSQYIFQVVIHQVLSADAQFKNYILLDHQQEVLLDHQLEVLVQVEAYGQHHLEV